MHAAHVVRVLRAGMRTRVVADLALDAVHEVALVLRGEAAAHAEVVRIAAEVTAVPAVAHHVLPRLVRGPPAVSARDHGARPRLLAARRIEVGVAEHPLVLLRRDLRLSLARVVLARRRAARAAPRLEERIELHADRPGLLDRVLDVLEVLVVVPHAEVERIPHVVVVLVLESRVLFGVGLPAVLPVLQDIAAHARHAVEHRVEVGRGVVVGLRIGQHILHDPEAHRNLGERLARVCDGDLGRVEAGLRVLIDAERREELLAAPLLQCERLDRLRVVDGLGARLEAGIDVRRRRDPHVVLLAVVADADEVRLLLFVDLHEVLVVEKKFGTKLQAHVVEVAVPGVAVLIPHLDDLEVDLRLRDDRALGALQIARGNRHARKVRIGLEDEACRLELVPARDDAQRPALLPVRRLPVGEPHLVAQRRNSPVIKLRRLRFTRGKSHARDAKRRHHPRLQCNACFHAPYCSKPPPFVQPAVESHERAARRRAKPKTTPSPGMQ